MLERTEIHPGVYRHIEWSQAVYIGKADALIAAGLVTLDQLPGQPGNGRGMCTYEPSGLKVQQGNSRRSGHGRKYIVAKKCSEGVVFVVSLLLSPERLEAIKAERIRKSCCWPFPVMSGDHQSINGLDRQIVYRTQEVHA